MKSRSVRHVPGMSLFPANPFRHQRLLETIIFSKWLFIALLAVSILSSCNKNLETENASTVPVTTVIPGSPLLHSFEIKLTDTIATTAVIEWSPAVDNQQESIEYRLLVDNVEIAGDFRLRKFIFSTLLPNKKYKVQIKAIDKKNNSILSTIEFTKFDGYLKYSKFIYDKKVRINDLVITNENAYVFCASNFGSLMVGKIDSLGNEIWSRNFKYTGTYTYIEKTDGGYFVMGYNYLIKVDLQGQLIWERVFEQYGTQFNAFIETKNKEIILTGYEQVKDLAGSYKAYASVVKLNSGGVVLFRKTLGTSPYFEQANDIIKSEDQSAYYVLGGRGTSLGFNDYWLFKMDENGNILWEKTYGNSTYNYPTQIRLINNQLVIAGYRNLAGDVHEMQVRRTDLNGNELKTFALKDQRMYDRVFAMEPTSDNGYVIVGNVGYGGANITGVFKYDASDKQEWFKTYTPDNYYSTATAIKQTADKGYIVPSFKFTNYNGDSGPWLLKLNPAGSYQ